MSDADLHSKMMTFLAGEFAKQENQVCVRLELMFSPPGDYKDEQIREWIRQDDPDLFGMARLPDFVTSIIDIAESEADAKPAGRYRFFLRTIQFLRGRQIFSFALQPAFRGNNDDSSAALALSTAGGGRNDTAQALQIVAQHASVLMRTNTGMFDGSLRSLGAANERLSKQNADLHAENIALRREVEDARSTRLKEEFEMSLTLSKAQRSAAGWDRMMQLAGVVVTKVAGSIGGGTTNHDTGSVNGQPSPLQILIGDLKKSLRPNQIQALFQTFDQFQMIMLNEIMSFAPPEPEPAPNQPPAPDSGQPSSP